MMERHHGATARASEARLSDAVYAAAAAIIGSDTARRLTEARLTDEAYEPTQGPVAKLARMQESARGRRWLDEHPGATWKDIEEATL